MMENENNMPSNSTYDTPKEKRIPNILERTKKFPTDINQNPYKVLYAYLYINIELK